MDMVLYPRAYCGCRVPTKLEKFLEMFRATTTGSDECAQCIKNLRGLCVFYDTLEKNRSQYS